MSRDRFAAAATAGRVAALFRESACARQFFRDHIVPAHYALIVFLDQCVTQSELTVVGASSKMLLRRTVREVGTLAISITFIAAIAVLGVIWHLPQPAVLDSLETVPNVLAMEARMNEARNTQIVPRLSSASRSKETLPLDIFFP